MDYFEERPASSYTRAMSELSQRQQGTSVGALLRYWRTIRRLSQLALAMEAQISARHLCFIETGRAKPSRDMLRLLAEVLDIPLRERNSLFLAAGFAPVYAESALDEPMLRSVQSALSAILRQQEPFPAVLMNRNWDILDTNQAATRFFGFLLGSRPQPAVPNVLRLMFDPEGLRPYVSNWPAVAEALVGRLRRESVGGVPDDAGKHLLAEILAYPGVPANLHTNAVGLNVPVVPVSFTKDAITFNYFSTVTTLGTPQDVTAQEIRLECFFPLDDETAQRARELT
ncbi:MAG: helix-turn-helix domain-containing protein [Myxococcota bacterium]